MLQRTPRRPGGTAIAVRRLRAKYRAPRGGAVRRDFLSADQKKTTLTMHATHNTHQTRKTNNKNEANRDRGAAPVVSNWGGGRVGRRRTQLETCAGCRRSPKKSATAPHEGRSPRRRRAAEAPSATPLLRADATAAARPLPPLARSLVDATARSLAHSLKLSDLPFSTSSLNSPSPGATGVTAKSAPGASSSARIAA